MKKFKKKTAIIVGVISAGIIGICGKMWYNANDPPVVSMYGVTMTDQQSINNKFLKYESASLKGSAVKSLKNEIITFNSDLSNPTSVKYTGPETSKIDLNKKYSIQFKYNDEGYVCEAIITEAQQTESTSNN